MAFLSGAVQPLLQTFTQRNEATAEPICWGERSQGSVKAGWERHTSSATVNTGVPAGDGKQLAWILLDSLKGQWDTESIQNRAAGFNQAGKGEAGRGEGEQSFVMVIGGQEQDQHCKRKGPSALPPSLGKHGVRAGHYPGERDRWDFSMDPQKSTSM